MQAPGVEHVHALATLLLNFHETSSFENPQVVPGCWPRARKPICDFTCGHPASTKMEHEENMAARRMRQRIEDCVDFG